MPKLNQSYQNLFFFPLFVRKFCVAVIFYSRGVQIQTNDPTSPNDLADVANLAY